MTHESDTPHETSPKCYVISFNCPHCENKIQMAAVEKEDKVMELTLLNTRGILDPGKSEEGQPLCPETPDTTDQCPEG